MTPHDTQKVILITGTSSGFGLLTSARLASRGHFVYATMRDLAKQQPLLDEVTKRAGQVQVRELDVTKPATIKKVIDEIKNRHYHIDVLINNAGFGLGGFFEDLSEDEIRQQMEVNLFGVQNVCRQVIPLMRERKQGKIINLSSIAGQTASPCFSAYNASKWALEGFSESLHHEMKLFGIDVVLVEPGSYPTKIFFENARYGKNFDNSQSPYYALNQQLQKMTLDYVRQLKRDPQEVAALIENIINTKNPKLRYISNFSSWLHVFSRKILPESIYGYFLRRVLYGNKPNAL
ncbi:MAG: SDR family oxidoreductase [Candidatus Omnitrophica bacterium]|nr:SDR family oxidoreductase [Candidatus Omnitrophota bacterium]